MKTISVFLGKVLLTLLVLIANPVGLLILIILIFTLLENNT